MPVILSVICSQVSFRIFLKVLTDRIFLVVIQSNSKEVINSIYLVPWISEFEQKKIEFNEDEDLPRLYRWAKEKESRLSKPGKRPSNKSVGSEVQTKITKAETLQNSLDSQGIPKITVPSRTLPLPPALEQQQYSASIYRRISNSDSKDSVAIYVGWN
ncbi:hypothetical protein BGZ60DRAFT_429809 [Tricladium varicosporioides]|nr:hypothetical protein BGZ60DRAFT_429809 [Hymenoscyphus varicosporioides]